MSFKPVNSNINFPEQEEKIIKYWKDNRIFEKSIEQRPIDKTWTFLDGPPFITGMPHYGTLLPSILKDLYPRYWTMKGYRVRRVWGWDCHGLPAENKVETKLGIKRKRDIEEKVGVKKFIDECKLYVNQVSGEWQWYIDHIARWVDFEHAYKTMDKDYMESVMWVFKQIYDKGLIYKGLRISLYCPHCSTPISNFEVAMDADNYKEVTEPANTYKYQLVDQKNTYLLAWSTTPWNKLVTPALAINPKLTYVKVKQNDEFYILAKSTLPNLNPDPYEIFEEFLGDTLLGLKFVPHYDFYPIDKGKRAFIIIAGDFITADEGTGIVTIAAYGEEDLEVMQRNNIQIVMHVDDEGKLKSNVPNWAGLNYLEVNPLVNADLKSRGLLYSEKDHAHTIPTCWRCHTRLFYAPQNSWYIDIQKLKPLLEKINESVNWFPNHFKHGRFLNSMKSAPDWCISRSRYWGSPVPVWECPQGHRFVPGSIAELEQASGVKINDLHKPDIDEVIINCLECNEKAKRVPEVLDSWIEAGSAAFAERHFPFSELKLEEFFPPDFIVEYTGQIRAWFYVLHVIAASIYESPAFKNVAVTGVILGTDGRKMSKNFGNYPDPKELLQKYGGDALRLYLAGNPVTRGEDMLISEEDYKNQTRKTLLILWNSYNYFVTYANIDKYEKSEENSKNILDIWLNVRLNELVLKLTNYFEIYDSVSAISELNQFVNDLSTWYIRRSRTRTDKNYFYSTCYQVFKIFCKASAPIIPFITEEIYQNLTGEESVHLTNWPKAVELTPEDLEVLKNMDLVRKIVESGLSVRKFQNIKVRQPLASFSTTQDQLPQEYEQLILDELNVKKINWSTNENSLNTNLTPDLIEEGQARDIVREVQQLRKDQGALLNQKISLVIPEIKNPDLLAFIQKQTLAKELTFGSEIHVTLLP